MVASLSVIYAAASVHLFPFPPLQGQLLLPSCSHETATLMVDVARSWCQRGTGSAASAPTWIKPWRGSLAFPAALQLVKESAAGSRAQSTAEPLPGFCGREIV